jgi:hypothetical protein
MCPHDDDMTACAHNGCAHDPIRVDTYSGGMKNAVYRLRVNERDLAGWKADARGRGVALAELVRQRMEPSASAAAPKQTVTAAPLPPAPPEASLRICSHDGCEVALDPREPYRSCVSHRLGRRADRSALSGQNTPGSGAVP